MLLYFLYLILYLSLALSYVFIISPAVMIVKQNIAQNSGNFKLNLCANFLLTKSCDCGIIKNSAAARPHAAQPFYHIAASLSIGKNEQKNESSLCNLTLDFYSVISSSM